MAAINIEIQGIAPFDCKGNSSALGTRWKKWFKSFEYFLLAKGVEKADQKRALLLHTDVQELFETLQDPGSGEGVEDEATVYEKTVRTLNAYFITKLNEPYERHLFRKMCQREGESVDKFIARLKQQADNCNFVNPDVDIRDQVIDKCRSASLRRKLLGKEDLTLTKLQNIARSMEAVDLQAQQMTEGNSSDRREEFEVNKVWENPGGNSKHKKKGKCFRCNLEGHFSRDKCCPARRAVCSRCKNIGHYAAVCKTRSTGRKVKQEEAQYVDNVFESSDDEALGIHTTMSDGKEEKSPIVVPVVIDGQHCEMQLDTGASVSIMPRALYEKYFSHYILASTNTKLKAYNGLPIPVSGIITLPVVYEGQEQCLPLLVVEGNGPALLGRNWLEKLKLNWQNILQVRVAESLSGVLTKHKAIFRKGLGTIKGFKADIKLQHGAQPIFCKARPVPYALRDRVEKELNRLETEGVVKKVERSDWASPIVCVPKKDGNIRICGDFKVSVNRVLLDNPYPLPDTEDIFATLGSGSVFSKIDLSNAYQQMEVSSESQQYLTVNTHKGLYAYQRLTFGIASAPAIFQATMDQILKGMDNVRCRIDDILIKTGPHEHLQVLDEVLTKLEKYGILVKEAKCQFMVPSVEFLGHRVDGEGRHPLDEKVAAIVEAPQPKNVSELRAYLGLLNYYGSFIQNLSNILHPLHELLQKGVKWHWSKDCSKAFAQSKAELVASKVLVPYDEKRKLILACDASPYGVGAVISHVMDDGQERPIAYASRTLTKSEKNYAQIDKEALGIVFGVRKFHKYLYGRSFTLWTDHKPLVTIFGPKSAVPTLAAARMQRWALILQAYKYDVRYRPSSEHANADALSRLPCTGQPMKEENEIMFLSGLDELPVSSKDIRSQTHRDPVLAKVLNHTLTGWPTSVYEEELKPYFTRRNELTVEQGCLLWGMRVVIPSSLRNRLLQELHEEHSGIVAMKGIARSFLWWPKLDAEIELLVKSCEVCQSVRKTPPVVPLHAWKWPTRVWQRVHIDFAEKEGEFFLGLIDSHSKWIEVAHMKSTTAQCTIDRECGL